jgi:hypothetical protein
MSWKDNVNMQDFILKKEKKKWENKIRKNKNNEEKGKDLEWMTNFLHV